ncbi:excinuclease ABC subunit UvrC [Haploplasma modicum]|jgi:excinuclease ABC subunit C|uniref:excinuclease ABC subunit UvrC n=1 Tax=Haploplasma modicum TaxID=2150 RepID=UPI00214BE91C|nr:excinuclease ABC subunit UvrC [Haploplasma modicum]MCR1808979.1 excinuclease ABC subunit UvrC [Haploplasma modicum]
MISKIKEKLSLLPDNPGCYLMKNKDSKIIYVGKAKNLKQRVKSYFTGAHNYKTSKLVSEIHDFEIVLTNSEQESLILELNLIKEHRPKYNVVFMDDKTYPYIEITKTIPPVIKVIRTKNVKGKIFGPYPNVKSARETARLLELLFPMGKIEKIPNFYEEIGKSIESDTSNNYELQVSKITKFLKGDIKEVTNALEKSMLDYSNLMMFERAAVIRDTLNHIKTTTEKQIISLNDYKDRDIIGSYYNDESIALQILFMRSGRIIDQHQTIFSYVGDPKEFILSYINQFYQGHFPDEILFDYMMFSEEDLTFSNVTFLPKIGDKRKIVELANKNAKFDLENYFLLYQNKLEKQEEAVSELKTLLNVDDLNLIEVFDNSQLFGTAPISAMIVFKDYKFNKKLYRKFNLKTTTNDDYKALQEVIYRRYYRILMENLERPDLILVDGGIGHVKIAKEVIDNLNLDIKVLGLKKNNKHQLESMVSIDREIILKDYPKVYQFLFKLSEEVHRYAISTHRVQRNKKAYNSKLDEITGLGEKRKRALLASFKDLDEIKMASFEQLKEIGLPDKVINKLKEVLNNETDN